MRQKLLELLGGNELLAGIICLLIAIALLVYQLKSKEKRPKFFGPYGMMEWSKYFSIWALIFIFLLYAYSLIF